jgi:hypothetical protein
MSGFSISGFSISGFSISGFSMSGIQDDRTVGIEDPGVRCPGSPPGFDVGVRSGFSMSGLSRTVLSRLPVAGALRGCDLRTSTVTCALIGGGHERRDAIVGGVHVDPRERAAARRP